MTMTRNNSLINVGNMIHKPGDLFTILIRQAITSGIRDLNCGSTSIDHSFNNSGEVVVVGATGIFCVKLNVVRKLPGPFYTLNGPLQNLFPCRIEFGFDVMVRCANARMYPGFDGMFQSLG